MPYPNQHAFRVKEPSSFVEATFKTKILEDGISIIVGNLKSDPNGSMVTQTYRFDKNKFSFNEAKKWMVDHNEKFISSEPASEPPDEKKSDYIRSVFSMDQIVTREDSGKRSITGYAARFNSRSVKFGDFYEVVSPGAFSRSVSDGNVVAIWNHNPDIVLGRQRSGTLQLVEDSNGLMFDLQLPDTQWGRDAYTSIQRRDVDGMSFGFRIRKSTWSRDENSKIRSLVDVDLKEISPTAFPAYSTTNVEARSMEEDYYNDIFSKLKEEPYDDFDYRRLYVRSKQLQLTL